MNFFFSLFTSLRTLRLLAILRLNALSIPLNHDEPRVPASVSDRWLDSRGVAPNENAPAKPSRAAPAVTAATVPYEEEDEEGKDETMAARSA